MFSHHDGRSAGFGRDGADNSDGNDIARMGTCVKETRVPWLGVVSARTAGLLVNRVAGGMGTLAVCDAVVSTGNTDGKCTSVLAGCQDIVAPSVHCTKSRLA